MNTKKLSNPFFNIYMSSKGYYRAEVLRVCLRDAGLNGSVTRQIGNILQEQFKPENYREIGGVAYFRNNWLELEMVYPQKIQEVERSLDKFSHGDYSGLEELSLFASEAVDFHQEHHGKNILLNAIKFSFKAAYKKHRDDSQDLLLSESERRSWVDRYKELMSHYTIVPLHEHIDQYGFLGWFHIHPSGSGPSPADINFSSERDLPALVFSALPTYQKTGIGIHLLHLGKSELLYQGLLQSQKQ